MRQGILVAFCFLLILLISCTESTPPVQNTTPTLSQSIDQLAKIWYPKSVDTVHGGFHSTFDYRWNLQEDPTKMIVSQARHIWSTATLADYYQEEKYKQISSQGTSFIIEKMWDPKYGGFNDFASFENDQYVPSSGLKTAYGNSFAIYGLTAYYHISHDTVALEQAKKTFFWLEKHSHDPEFGGYFNLLEADGRWRYLNRAPKSRDIQEEEMWKDMNSSIHLLEAYTTLYEVWPDTLLRTRLQELYDLISTSIFTDKGYMTLFLERDWSPVSYMDSAESIRLANIQYDHVSFGHDVETAFLLLEAAKVLGIYNESSKAFARKIVDHAVQNGWDEQNGGFYDYGYYLTDDKCSIVKNDKVWWTQAEGLNALKLMSGIFPQEKQYDSLYQKQWSYINTYLVDQENGEWFIDGLDANPQTITANKAHIWKTNYHNLRALINCQKMSEGSFPLLAL